jgi:hypothetical protein
MTALARLTSGYYNSQPYDAGDNPGGLGNGGHVINFPLCLADFAVVANDLNAAVLDAGAVSTAATQVALDKAAVLAAAGPVIAGMAAFGLPAMVAITNLNTLASSGFFSTSAAATGRPAGETTGYLYAISDGASTVAAQIFLSATNSKTYTRNRIAGTWQSWVELTTAATATDTAFGAEATVASAATVQLGNQGTRMVEITGVTTITSFGSTGGSTTNPHYLVRFAGALTLTHNGASLILPGAKNIATAAGDHALMQYLGGGNWRCVSYHRANGEALVLNPYGAEVNLASAATADLGAAASSLINITGATAITSLGASASTARPLYRLRFAGALTLTHNAVSLILPGGANIATASGDSCIAQYLGGGNWRVLAYSRGDGSLRPGEAASTAEAKAGALGNKAVTPAGLAGAVQSGCMEYAADSSSGANTVVAALTPAPSALVEGMAVLIKIQGDNTGAATLDLNGLGAVSIKLKGNNLPAGALRDGQIAKLIYDGSFWQLQGVGGAVASSLGFSGYRIHDDGFIEQWGQVFVTSAGSGTGSESAVVFPVTFPNAITGIKTTVLQSSGAIGGAVKDYVRIPTTTGMNVGLDEVSGSGNFTVYWKVEGY